MESLKSLVERLEAVTIHLENRNISQVPATSSSVLNEFDDIINNSIKEFMNKSAAIGTLVQNQSLLVNEAFQASRNIINVSCQSKKPNANDLNEIIQPLQKLLLSITDLREKNRSSALFNHLSVVSEGIPALGWVVVEPTPVPYLGDMKESAQFYCNRVIKEFKEKDKIHVEWAQSYITVLTDLQAYVKKNHTTGLSWNSKGGDAKTFSKTAATKPSSSAPIKTPDAASSSNAKPLGSVLGELGDNVTSGLRKVDKSEMTHKNPELRASSVVKSEPLAPAKPPVKIGAIAKSPPKLALEGNKWVVENFMNDSNVVIDKAELRHVVYIYNCTNCTIQVKGKVNAVSVDGSKKCGVLIENVVSTVDVVNCKSLTLQITGRSPTLAIDKTDGLQLYLSKENMDIEILSAKSSEMNILTPKGDDFVEIAVPEQFKTTFVNEYCQQTLTNSPNAIMWISPTVPYSLLKPIFQSLPRIHLCRIEGLNFHIKEETDELWKTFSLNEFSDIRRDPLFKKPASWRSFYDDRIKSIQEKEERTAKRLRELKEQQLAEKSSRTSKEIQPITGPPKTSSVSRTQSTLKKKGSLMQKSLQDYKKTSSFLNTPAPIKRPASSSSKTSNGFTFINKKQKK